MNTTRRRYLNTSLAFAFTLATAGLVWQNGWRTGQRQIAPSPSPLPKITPRLNPAPNAFTNPATARLHTSDLADRIDLLVERGQKARTDSEQGRVAQELYTLGRDAHFQDKGSGPLSQRAYEESLTLFQRIGDKDAAASVLADLSDTLRLLGKPDRAETVLRSALVLRKAGVGIPQQQADVLYRLGDLLRFRGRYTEARRILDSALRLQQRLSNEPGMADCLSALGQTAYEDGSLALARQLLTQAAQLFEKQGKVESRAAVLGQLGDVALAEGERAEAERLYREGLRVWQARHQGFWSGRFLIRLARLALAEKNVARADAFSREGHQLLLTSNGPSAEAEALLVRGEVARQQGNLGEAARLLTQAETRYREAGNAFGLAQCRTAQTALRQE